MPQTNNALTYLPDVKILVTAGSSFSTRALKAALNRVSRMQNDATPTGVYTAERCLTDSPYFQTTWDITVTAPANATGTVTAATAIAGNTVTINGLLYTAVAGVKADNTEFSIDTGNTETAADLADSVNADVRVGTLGDVSATSALAAVTLTQATIAGTPGNATTLTSSGATLAVSGATFTGGLDNGEYTLAFVSEDIDVITTINRPALTSRRLLDISYENTAFFFTVRSAQAALNAIEKFEDAVASTGISSTGDGVYTSLPVKGPSPYDSYTWDITKTFTIYIVTPTAGS